MNVFMIVHITVESQAQNSSDNYPSYSPDNHHSSYVVCCSLDTSAFRALEVLTTTALYKFTLLTYLLIAGNCEQEASNVDNLAPRKSFDILALYKSDYYYYYYLIPSSVKIPRVKNKLKVKRKAEVVTPRR